METYIKGTFKKTIFSSNDGFTVGVIKINDTNDLDLEYHIGEDFTFTGLFHELKMDEDYILYGSLIDNEKYGFQFKVDRYEKIMPEDKEGIIAFLSSSIFNKVGEKTARKIVDTLGIDCLEKIKEDYSVLLLVPKITEKRAIDIRNKLLKYNESYEIVIYLTTIGFSMKDALKVYNHYLEDTKRVINDNPYELIDTIEGISFNKIDSLKLNIDKKDERRILALIIYLFNEVCFSSGDTYLEFETIKNAVRLLEDENISEDKLNYYLLELNKLGKIIIDNDKFILKSFYKDELYIANSLYDLSNKEDEIINNIEVKIEKVENYFNINYNEEQKRAIKQSLIKNVSIITGGPGTGKTTIIKAIIEMYKIIKGYSPDKLKERLVLLAPTGRAAKRMSEACLYPASTIHRYLKWNKETNDFGYNERNKAKAEFIIVDETSMVDTYLMSNFLRALPNNIKLVFVGDYNQLESVGPGNVLRDLIESDMINTIFLKDIYRQDQNSFITELAYEVNNGELTESILEKKDDYNFIRCESSDVLKVSCDVCKLAVDKKYDLKDIQILAPMYKGFNGIDNLNYYLQKIFNPKSNTKNETYDGNITYREGDKILQLENMVDDNVFNGDIGFINKIDGSQITIDFDGNMVKYDKKDYKKIKHGYAISVHKSQGSEFDIVIIPVINDYKSMLYRKLIYTAITRAKKSLILVGSVEAFNKAVFNKGNKVRRTLLKKMLEDKLR